MARFNVLFALCYLASAGLGQTTWYVSASVTGPGNGSATAPFATIQAGIDAAANGEEICVLPGTYEEHLSYVGKDIRVYGRDGVDVTIIDATFTGTAVSFVNFEGAQAILEGFRVARGLGSGVDVAGGIQCVNSSPTIIGCIIVDCVGADGSTPGHPLFHISAGAGAVYSYSGDPSFKGCVFALNRGGAGYEGADGGSHFCTGSFYQCGDPGEHGGDGGAPLALIGGNPHFESCWFVRNFGGAGGDGGDGGWGYFGMASGGSGGDGGASPFDFQSTGTLTVLNCTVADNVPGSLGLAGMTLANAFNGEPGQGGVLRLGTSALLNSVNSIYWNNGSAANFGSTGYLPTPPPVLDHCTMDGQLFPGPGNNGLSPEFIDRLAFDYHILPSSPCRDTGTNSANFTHVTDIDGQTRIYRGIVDRGADEAVVSLTLSQPNGPGGPVFANHENLIQFREYYTLVSFDLCVAVGAGPYLGLCASDPSTLVAQFLLPAGTPFFHFHATGESMAWGPFSVPPSTFDVIAFDFTGGSVEAVSLPVRFTAQ